MSPLSDAIFGPITGTPQVEFAVLDTLETWVPFMLKVIERREGFPRGTLIAPPGRNSYRGGIDFDSWDGDCLPNIIAVVQPAGDVTRKVGAHAQWFDVGIAVVVITESEDESRILAGHMGTAVIVSLAQHGDLGGIASATVLESAAATLEFPDPDKRRLVRARADFQVYVEGLVDDLAGPKTASPPESPQYPGDPDEPFEDWPARIETNITVTRLD